MLKYSVAALAACLLAGCTQPTTTADAGAPPQTKPKKVHCEPPTGSHIVDYKACNPDAFAHHGVIADRSGNPYEAQGNPPGVQ